MRHFAFFLATLLSFAAAFLLFLVLVLILPLLFLALLALSAAALTLALALPLAILALLALASTLALPFAARGSLATHCGECTHGLNVLGLRHALLVDLASEGDHCAHGHVPYLRLVQEDVAVVLSVGLRTLDESETLLRVEGLDPALEFARRYLAHLLLPRHPLLLHERHHRIEPKAPRIAHPGAWRHGILWLGRSRSRCTCRRGRGRARRVRDECWRLRPQALAVQGLVRLSAQSPAGTFFLLAFLLAVRLDALTIGAVLELVAQLLSVGVDNHLHERVLIDLVQDFRLAEVAD
mmetsp:Transcript_95447/g.247188  ORF Transcript_95447/g.247188 Transcript_95447/m.247188 type:complete len:295 (-) Transcript_95447:361-1245(-)